MLTIRLFRIGKKHQPSFKIVVTDKRKPPRSGRFVEEVGFYNPLTKEKVLKQERIKYWLSVGVKPSATVNNLLIKEKILEGKKIAKHKVSKKEPSSAKAIEGKEEKPAPEEKVEKVPTPASTEATAGKEEKPAKKAPAEEKPEVEKPKETKEKKAAPERDESRPESSGREEIPATEKPAEESSKKEEKEEKTE